MVPTFAACVLRTRASALPRLASAPFPPNLPEQRFDVGGLIPCDFERGEATFAYAGLQRLDQIELSIRPCPDCLNTRPIVDHLGIIACTLQ